MLTQTVFRSEDLPVADRFDAWCEIMGRVYAPMKMTSEFAADFRAHLRCIPLGEVTVYPTTFQQTTFRRTPRLIRQSDPEAYHLSVLLDGEGGTAWDGHEAAYRPLDLHIVSTSLPHETWSGRLPATIVGVEIPRAALPLPCGRADRAIGRQMSGREGVGALLTQFLTHVAADVGSYRPDDAPRLGTVLTDLVAALFAHNLAAEPLLPPEAHRRTLLLRIQRFIHHSLTEGDLTPSRVAAAMHLSRSYLHRLFQQEGITVAGYIRRLRLEAARRDLADPAQHCIPIHAIAARWGYPRAADFTRAFRATYGMPPIEYRRDGVRRQPC
ncbi:AraC family transcriptional regulator [Streptomyces sp. NPDC007162]|uniref:AraC family transcriptional regulator n=1 Tax=Streptomyces sp. NPDC007162 TaxID=3156917 RepID=UPI0034001911